VLLALIGAFIGAAAIATLPTPSPAFAAVGDITTVAGDGNGDGRQATVVGMPDVGGVAIDSSNNLYVAERGMRTVRKIDLNTGVVSTFAGTGAAGGSGNGGPATAATFSFPYDVAVDPGNTSLYIADGPTVRKVDLVTGIISAVAGPGGDDADGIPATDAYLHDVGDIAFDAAGNLYLADRVAHKVRVVDAVSGLISTVAGTGAAGNTGDGAAAAAATLNAPEAVAVDTNGDIYIGDTGNHRVRKVTKATGEISPFAGTGAYGSSGDGAAATAATLSTPTGLVTVGTDVVIADRYAHRVRIVSGGMISPFAGTGTATSTGDNGPATTATTAQPISVAVGPTGDVYVGENTGRRVRKVADATGVITTVAGDGTAGYSGDGAAATNALLGKISDVAVLSNGDMIVADPDNDVLRRISASDQSISTFAGTGQPGFSGDNGPATSAMLRRPTFLSVDADDNVYVSDADNNRIRRIDPAGVITLFAGNGASNHSGDNGPATAAGIAYISGTAVLPNGDLLIAEQGTYVRKVEKATGLISTIAGTGMSVSAGDNGPAAAASFKYASAFAVDGAGNVFVVDTNAGNVRRIDAATTTISTVAGLGNGGAPGDNGPALAARFASPIDIEIDSSGNLFISDRAGHRVRRIDASTQIITTIAGTGVPGFSGDGGPATTATLLEPNGLAIDGADNVLVADSFNRRVRMIQQTEPPAPPPTLPPTLPPTTEPTTTTTPDQPTGPTPPPDPIDDRYHPVSPERLLDTRLGIGAPTGTLPAGQTLQLQVTGTGTTNVPADATAAVLNITVTQAADDGYATIYPCDQPRPTASNLNYTAGQTIPNLVIAKLAADGTVCLYTDATVHLIADINGWYPAG
jgi:hypothetical protein